MTNEYLQGYEAYHVGNERCPYVSATIEYYDWWDGWTDAENDAATLADG
jgi:ribosome modulation factor